MTEILIGLLLEFLGEVVFQIPAPAHLSGIRARWLAVAR